MLLHWSLTACLLPEETDRALRNWRQLCSMTHEVHQHLPAAVRLGDPSPRHL